VHRSLRPLIVLSFLHPLAARLSNNRSCYALLWDTNPSFPESAHSLSPNTEQVR
jgi:hypothetical protein